MTTLSRREQGNLFVALFSFWWDLPWIWQMITAIPISIFVGTGISEAYNEPPRLVASWKSREVRVCKERDSSGDSCIRYGYETEYWVTSRDGGVCEVTALTYAKLRQDQPLKCFQFFGWWGGYEDPSLFAGKPRDRGF